MTRPPAVARDRQQSDPLPVTSLTHWLAEHVPEMACDDDRLTIHPIAGGKSNLTYRLTDTQGRDWVVRRPPVGGRLDTAHDMHREWRFLQALHPTPVPVARPVAFCADDSVIGAPFYVTTFVHGRVLADVAAAGQLSPAARRRAGESTIDTLAALHAVAPAAVGLGDGPPTDGYIERQLRRWTRQVQGSAVEDLTLVEDVARRLAERRPEDTGTAITHGDYRPGNLAFSDHGDVTAVFDWELATVGDPLADLGYLLASWGRPGDTQVSIGEAPSVLDGFAEREDLVKRYASASGRRVDDIAYYVAFAKWRSACIRIGVYTRYVRGLAESGGAADPAVLGAMAHAVESMAAAAHAALPS